jgi:hypothetical protein
MAGSVQSQTLVDLVRFRMVYPNALIGALPIAK